MFLQPFKTRVIEFNVPVDDGVAYAAGDAIGVKIKLSQLLYQVGRTTELLKVVIFDDDNQGAALNLFFFDTAIADATDNTAFAPTAAESKRCRGVLAIGTGDYITQNSNKYATKQGAPLLTLTSELSVDFWLQIVSAGTPTYTADTTVRVQLTIAQH